jgi:hypothetical protein
VQGTLEEINVVQSNVKLGMWKCSATVYGTVLYDLVIWLGKSKREQTSLRLHRK